MTSWSVTTVTDLLAHLRTLASAPVTRPLIVAIDGRSASGKSTLAHRLSAAATSSVVVHTDDLAWHEPYFTWGHLLRHGVLEPLRRGEPVAYTPPQWRRRGRSGAIVVPDQIDLVIIEGVGAAQDAVGDLIDAVVWVQSDAAEAQRRGIARDIAQGVNGDEAASVAFWHEWMAHELRFLEREQTWSRAQVIVCGTPQHETGADEVLISTAVAPGAPRPAG